MICLADAGRIVEDQVVQKFTELAQSKQLLDGPALLFVFEDEEAHDGDLPECAISIPKQGVQHALIGQHMSVLLSKLYQKLQGDCDILHALPEDSIICTEEDEITKNGESLKGIFTYEEIKTTSQPAGSSQAAQSQQANNNLAQSASPGGS